MSEYHTYGQPVTEVKWQATWKAWSEVGAAPLTDKCKSTTADEVRKLQAEVRERLQHVQAVHEGLGAAREGLKAAEAKVLAELDADAESMSDGSSLERVHAEQVKALRELTEVEELHEQRLKRTTSLAQQAQVQLDQFVASNWQELHAELEPQANKVSERVRKITAEYEQKLSPFRQDWTQILNAQTQIVGRTDGIHREDLPAEGDYAQPPVVSSEALARLNQVAEPAHQAPAVSIGAVTVSA